MHAAQPDPTVIYENNMETLGLCANPILHQLSKHISIKYYFRELIAWFQVDVIHMPIDQQHADFSTKALGSSNLKKFILLIMRAQH